MNRTAGPGARLVEKIKETKSGYIVNLTPGGSKTEDSKEKKGGDLVKAMKDKKKCLADNWLSDFCVTQWTSIRTRLIDSINKITVKAKEVIDDLMFTFTGDNFINLVVISLLTTCEQLVNGIIVPFDPVFVEISYKYNEVLRKWREYKNLRTNPEDPDEDERKTRLAEMTEYLVRQGEGVCSAILVYMLIEPVSELLDVIKEIFKAGQHEWENVIGKFRDLHALIKTVCNSMPGNKFAKSLLGILAIIIPAAAALACGIACARESDDKFRAKARESLSENMKANGLKEDAAVSDQAADTAERYNRLSILIEAALKNLDSVSLSYKEDGSESKSADDTVSTETISVCYTPDERIDYDTSDKKRYVLEIGKDIIAKGGRLTPQRGAKIKQNQKIGECEGIPILSTVSGRVTKRYYNYIVIEDDADENEIMSEINSARNTADMTDRFSPLIDRFKKIAYAESYVKDLAVYCRFPSIALHSKKKGTYRLTLLEILLGKKLDSKDRFKKDYNKALDKKMTSHQKSVKRKCGKSKIKTAANNQNMNGVTKDIMSEKDAGYRMVVDMYRNWIRRSSKWCADNADTYMLLSDYIEFAADKSVMYEEDNPFAKRLFDALASFVDKRSRIEKVDRQSLIKNFNKKCSALLGNRMGKGMNYWNYFSSRFRANYYVQGSSGVIGVSDAAAAGNESDFDTLYRKMYDHIMNLLQCGTVKRGTEEVSTEVDSIDAFVNQTDQNEEMSDADKKIIEKQNDAKAIVRYYMLARGVKASNKKSSSKQTLAAQTRSEERVLDKIFNDAVKWREKDADLLDIDKLKNEFKKFMSVDCPYRGTIYLNNIPHTHYVFSTSIETAGGSGFMTDIEANGQCSAKTGTDNRSMHYWLLYCSMATLVNCMIPIYWGTGLNIMGVPIPLPVIYLPIYYLSGSCGVLFGLGICGIAVWPMIVFINNTAYDATMLIPINLVIDLVRKKLNDLADKSVGALKSFAMPFIKECDDEIEEIEKQIKVVDTAITKYKLNAAGVDNMAVSGAAVDPAEGYDTGGSRRSRYGGAASTAGLETGTVDMTYDEAYIEEIRKRGQMTAEEWKKAEEETRKAYRQMTERQKKTEQYAKDTTGSDSNGSLSTGSDKSYSSSIEYNPTGTGFNNVIVCLDAAHNKYRSGKRTPWLCTKTLPTGYKTNESWMDLYEYKWSREVIPYIKSGLERYGVEVYEVTPQDTEGDASQDNLTRRKNRIAAKVTQSGKHAVYLSIHGNAAGSGTKWYGANGWAIYTTKDRSKDAKGQAEGSNKQNSVTLAQTLFDEAAEILPQYGKTINRIGELRTAKHWETNDFGAVNNTFIPTVLTENLFYTNPDDCKFMSSDTGKRVIAQIHVNGVLKFIKKMKWV